jgi:phosphoribulokinase
MVKLLQKSIILVHFRSLEIIVETFNLLLSVLDDSNNSTNGLVVKKKQVSRDSDDEDC